MKKVTISLVVSVLIILSPVLVQAQGFGAGGFGRAGSGVASFGGRSFSRGSTVSGFRGGFSNGSVTSTPRGVGFGRGSNRGFVNSGFGQRGLSSKFSDNSTLNGTSNLTTSTLNTSIPKPQVPNITSPIGRRSFGSRFPNNSSTFNGTSNLTTSTLNTSIPKPQVPNVSNPKGGLVKSVKSGSKSFSSNLSTTLSTTRTNNSMSNSIRDRIITKENRNIPFTNNINSTLKGTTKPLANGKKAVSISKGLNLNNLNSNPTVATTGINNPGPNFMRNRVVTKKEGSGTSANLSTSPTARTEIVHWVDRKNGVMHFTNNISSIPKEEKTITFVNGKKAVSTSRGLNADRTLTTSPSLTGALSSTPKSPLRLAMKQNTNSMNSDHGFIVDNNQSIETVFNFSFNFFPNPFIFQPFFSPAFFNPFVFDPFVTSPFFTFSPLIPSPVFNPFFSQPIFLSPFFNPFGPVFIINTFASNNLNIN